MFLSLCIWLQDHAGRTPLQCAAYGGYITCMAVLMENNADPNIQDKEVNITTFVWLNVENCFPQFMFRRKKRFKSTMWSAFMGLQGRTALHWSCNNGYLDAVKLLLGYNAFPNQMEHTEER